MDGKWRLWRQKQVSQAGISNCIRQYTVGCNYLSVPAIPASGAKDESPQLWGSQKMLLGHSWEICCNQLCQLLGVQWAPRWNVSKKLIAFSRGLDSGSGCHRLWQCCNKSCGWAVSRLENCVINRAINFGCAYFTSHIHPPDDPRAPCPFRILLVLMLSRHLSHFWKAHIIAMNSPQLARENEVWGVLCLQRMMIRISHCHCRCLCRIVS